MVIFQVHASSKIAKHKVGCDPGIKSLASLPHVSCPARNSRSKET